MKAARILQFGPPSVIVNEDMERPKAGEGQLLVQVKAAGVGPWDALIREGKSTVSPAPPLILGSDLAGIVAEAGTGVFGFKAGDEVYGSTNDGFVGAYAEYALASAAMMAPKPRSLNFLEAASAPVVAVTAWQMLFDYAHAQAGQTVLILGAGGNVGAYAVQLARNAGLNVIATASANDVDYVRGLGANMVFDYHRPPFEDAAHSVDAVIDTVGGTTSERSLRVLKPGGILVSAVSPVPEETAKRYGVKAVFFYVEVTTSRLQRLTELFDSKKLVPCVGTVLPLSQARVAHDMLAGAPHDRGKIVLKIAS
jgi:NADPH:quinone reductase-like Zn-dependent oxidoreductase